MKPGLDDVDQAIIDFAEKAASEPSNVTQSDVNILRDKGLTDRKIFDVAFAVAARAFFVTLIESLGTRAEQRWVNDLERELLKVLEVGKPAKKTVQSRSVLQCAESRDGVRTQ